jgi:metal-responsive CopG/Arc/MetJ family transcriptional regulator
MMKVEDVYRERPERGKLVGVYMDEDLAVRSLEWARKNYMSRSKLIRCLLAEFLKEQEDEQEDLDTRQYNHIVWSDSVDLKKKLINRIEATLPIRPRRGLLEAV